MECLEDPSNPCGTDNCEKCCEHGDWMDSHCGYCGYYAEDRIEGMIDDAMDRMRDGD